MKTEEIRLAKQQTEDEIIREVAEEEGMTEEEVKEMWDTFKEQIRSRANKVANKPKRDKQKVKAKRKSAKKSRKQNR